MPDIAPKESYSREEVRRLLAITERQLRGWERHDLIRPQQSFTLPDLIALRSLVKLRGTRVPLGRIRLAISALRNKLRDVEDPLRELRVVADGKRIRVEYGDQHMEPVSGQLLFNFDKQEIRQLLSFPGSRQRAPSQKETAERWFQKGLELEQAGAPVQEAIEAYETAARLDPTSAGALVNLGTIYFNARMWAQAETFYRRALEADPDYALAHFNIGNLYDERGDFDRALLHYEAAVQIQPAYADAHYNLALLYQSAGQVMEAVRHWKTYLKLDPSSSWGAIARRELDKIRKSTVVQGFRRSSQTALE